MNSTSPRARALVLTAVCCLSLPCAVQAIGLPAPTRDALTPPPDKAMALRLARYQRSRQATFLDWLPEGGMLIGTRFGATEQVHRVATALGSREQLTFDTEPITVARAPRSGRGFVYLEGPGGHEPNQVEYYSPGGHIRALTHGTFVHGGLTWAHDGKRIAFYGNERDGVDLDVYVADVTKTEAPHLVLQGGPWLPLDWSADDQKLLLLKSVSPGQGALFTADVATGALTPVATSGSVRTARFAPDGIGIYLISVQDEFAQLRYVDPIAHQERTVSPQLSWDVEDFDVSADGRYLAYTVNEDGRSALTVEDTVSKVELTPPDLPGGRIVNLEFDRTGHRLALSLESAQSPRDVYVYDLDRVQGATVRAGAGPALTRWTRSEPGPVDPATFAPAELVHYPTWDRVSGHARLLSAYVYRPRTTTPSPVLISLHGGPDEQYRPGWEPFFQFLVNELGYAVVAPNVRGSSGYGKSFLALDNGVLRQDAVRDVGSLLVWISLQPAFDPKHVAVMGRDYGGYLAMASLADYGDRLIGAIDVRGISDFVDLASNMTEPSVSQWRLEYGDERETRIRDYLERISPLNTAARVQEPVLVIQSPGDTPQSSDAQELVWKLRSRGNEVWSVTTPEDGDEAPPARLSREAYLTTAAMFLKKLSGGNLTATASP